MYINFNTVNLSDVILNLEIWIHVYFAFLFTSFVYFLRDFILF